MKNILSASLVAGVVFLNTAAANDDLFLAETPLSADELSDARGGLVVDDSTISFGGFVHEFGVQPLIGTTPVDVDVTDLATINVDTLDSARGAAILDSLSRGAIDPILGQHVVNNSQPNFVFSSGFRVDLTIPNFNEVNGLQQSATQLSDFLNNLSILTQTGF